MASWNCARRRIGSRSVFWRSFPKFDSTRVGTFHWPAETHRLVGYRRFHGASLASLRNDRVGDPAFGEQVDGGLAGIVAVEPDRVDIDE